MMPELQMQDYKSEAPLRTPIYGEPLLGDEAFLEPVQALQLFCSQLECLLDINPLLTIGAVKIECIKTAVSDEGLQAKFLVNDTQAQASLNIVLAGDWICATVEFERSHFRFFIERVYEDWEVWPPQASAEGDSPGTVGAKLHWVSLDVSAWNGLSRETERQFLTVEPFSSVLPSLS